MAYYENTRVLVDWKIDVSKSLEPDGSYKYEQENMELRGMDVLIGNLGNYLASPKGSRSRLFRPNYGCNTYGLEHSLMTADTEEKIKVNLWQDMNNFHPEVSVSMDSIYIEENIDDPEQPAYDVSATLRYRGAEEPISFTLYKL